jgi:hypothetical protein
MVGYLSKKPKLSFVDDPGKLYGQRRRSTQAKRLETLDSKAEVEGPSKSPRESLPPSPKEDQPQPPPVGEQPQPERKIELCTPEGRSRSRRRKAVQDQGLNYLYDDCESFGAFQ